MKKPPRLAAGLVALLLLVGCTTPAVSPQTGGITFIPSPVRHGGSLKVEVTFTDEQTGPFRVAADVDGREVQGVNYSGATRPQRSLSFVISTGRFPTGRLHLTVYVGAEPVASGSVEIAP